MTKKADVKKKSKMEKFEEFENNRRQTCMGQCCMNVCYFFLTLLIILLFCGFFMDVYLKYQTELHKKEMEIRECGLNYTLNWCDRNGGPPALQDDCRFWDECKVQEATMHVKFSNVLPRLMGETINDFAESMALKSIAILTGIVCFITCGLTMCRFTRDVAKRMPEQIVERTKRKRRHYTSSTEGEEDSSSEDEEKSSKKSRPKNNQLSLASSPYQGQPVFFVTMPPDLQYDRNTMQQIQERMQISKDGMHIELRRQTLIGPQVDINRANHTMKVEDKQQPLQIEAQIVEKDEEQDSHSSTFSRQLEIVDSDQKFAKNDEDPKFY